MEKIHPNALASIEFQLNWQSQVAAHIDCYFAPKVNFWRDFMPVALQEALMDTGARIFSSIGSISTFRNLFSA